MSLNAYQKTQTAAESPRDTEYRLFAQVTRALKVAQESGVRDQAFFEALDWNRRMWSTLSSDCAMDGNGFPQELRAEIISLALWVSQYSTQVAQGEEDIDALIDINRTIMEGLATKPGAETGPAAGAAASGLPLASGGQSV